AARLAKRGCIFAAKHASIFDGWPFPPQPECEERVRVSTGCSAPEVCKSSTGVSTRKLVPPVEEASRSQGCMCMASEEDKSHATNGGGAPVLDTSWIDDSVIVAVAGGGSGGVTRGRGGGKRRTRRRTLSPSIGKHNYMSNVDLNDPMKYPSLPSSGGDDGSSSNRQKSSSHDQEIGGGSAELTLCPPPQRDTGAAATSPGADSAAASVPASPSGSTASPDTDLPDPTAVADLFEAEEGTTPAPRPSPLGTLGNNEAKPSSLSAPKKKTGEGKREPLAQASLSSAAAVARGRRSRRATFGGADARIHLEAENLAPVLPSKPPNPVPAASGPTATRSPRAMDGEVVGAAEEQASGLSTATAAAAVTRPGDGEETQERVPPPPPPAAATKKSRSRSSRRRSIVMPCEAQPLMDSDLGDANAEAETANMPPPPPPPATGGDGTATTAAAPPADGDGKPTRGSTSRTDSPADELPLSSINVVSCLSRSLAAQRGWPVGDEDTRKRLFRAFYGAAPGSQRARRVAARLFCLTGYALSAVAPEDARVLCEAAGDSMEWGLEREEPRLVGQPVRRESKEQKRGLVLRIKPLFELMDKASKDEKLKAESATGVVSRKAAPDGFCYEDRETGEPVEPAAYKGPYLRHVRDVRASRVREFAAARRVVAAAAAAAAAVSASACPETAVDGIMPGVEKSASSSVKGTAIPVACASPARAEAASKSRRDGEGLVADPGTGASAAAGGVTVGESSTEKESLPPGTASGGGVDNNGDTPSKKIDGGGAVVAIGEGEARDDVLGGEEADVLTMREGVTQEASPEAAAETPRTMTSGEGGSVGATAVVATDAAAVETLVASSETAVVDGARGEEAMAETLCRHGDPLAGCGNRVDSVSERVVEVVSVHSPRRGGQTPRISTTGELTSRNGESGGESSVSVLGPSSSPPGAAAAAAAANAAASPSVKLKGQHEESLSGRTPGSGGRTWKASPFGGASPFSAGAPTVLPGGGVAVSPGEDDEEGAEEIAALEKRLWAVVDAALREYHDGVALVRSRRNHNAIATAAAASEAEENSTALSRVPDAEAGATPPPAAHVGETAASMTSSVLGREEEASAPGLPAKAATATTTPLTGVDRTRAVAAPAAVTVDNDGHPTPDSPLLPLLQLRLSEEEDDDRFEYSLAWGGAGAEAAGGGGGPSQARGGKPRRRSLAKAFSSHKTRKEPIVHEGVGARPTAQAAGNESEAGGDGVGGGKTTRLMCRLCCRNACDTVMKPCQHSACGVCMDKLRVQAEQSGQALSCPWDRRGVDEIGPLQEKDWK
ncbi:unnamed protein product, partial [Ectocarpus fasciculatus]